MSSTPVSKRRKGTRSSSPAKGKEKQAPAGQEITFNRADSLRRIRFTGAELLTQAQVKASVGLQTGDALTDRGLQEGAVGLLDEFAPSDAVEATLAPVIVGLRNAVMMSLAVAPTSEGRDLELMAAMKGATVLVKLLEAYDAHRGNGRRHVSVGSVKVEPGAQAIVGNVTTPVGRKNHDSDGGPEAD